MKKALVIMTLVVVLSFILTAYFIVNKKVEYNLNRSTGYTIVNIDNSSNYNNSNVEKTIKLYKEYHQNIVDDVTGTNIDDVFYENNLIWNKVKYNVTDDIYGEYYQISGLKNKEVENKINIKLENSFKNFIDDNKNYILKKIAEAIKEEEYRYNQGWEERVDNHPYILKI